MGADDVTLNAKECKAWVAKAKPCPFCGCDKIMMYTNEAAVFQCRNRDCLAKISVYMENEYPDECETFKDYLHWLAKEALAKWNRRA